MNGKTRFYKCDGPSEFKKSRHYHRTIVDEKRESAENRVWLCHHTNTEALLKKYQIRLFAFLELIV